MKFMEGVPDKAYDLGSGDPPYFKRVGKMGYFGARNSSIGVKRGLYNIPNWDNQIPTELYFKELKRVSRNQIIWGANYYEFIGPVHKTPRRPELNQWLKDHPTGWIVWDKVNGDSDFNDFELAWTSFNMPTVIFKYLWNGMLQAEGLNNPTRAQGNKKKNQVRIHPTQKPYQLYEWTFSLSTFSGPILETHGGSMSAGVAGFNLGVDIDICELDKDYFESGQKRLDEHILKYAPASEIPVTKKGEIKLF
jgi:site-specific DNA-methyltransferase (adenine-specific)